LTQKTDFDFRVTLTLQIRDIGLKVGLQFDIAIDILRNHLIKKIEGKVLSVDQKY
jgi:hypothetical protein